MRAPELESVIFLRAKDPTPCLVYADWLAERGSAVEALGYRLLGGVAERDDELVHQLALMAVACAVFALETTPLDDDVDALEDDEWLSYSDDAHTPHFGAHRAVEACAQRLGGDSTEMPLLPRGTGGLINEAATELIGSTFNGRNGWARAAALARQAAPPAPFLRAWRMALSSLAANPRLPLSSDSSLATALLVLTDDDLQPVTHQVSSLEFGHPHSDSPRGRIVPWHPGATPGRAFTTAALHHWSMFEEYEECDASLRRELVMEEFRHGGRTSWKPVSLFRAAWLLMRLAAENDGPLTVGQEQRQLFDALDELGPYTRGAVSLGSSPLVLYEFVRGWVLLEMW